MPNGGSSRTTSTMRAVMSNRLNSERVGLLFIGPANNGIRSAVERTLSDAGATMVRMRAISVPINGHSVEGSIARHSALVSYASGPRRWSNMGRELADEFVAGGATPLWDALEGQIVEER